MVKQVKNYFGFINDESGSMSNLRQAAIKDYNANISTVKDAATKHMQDTIVSMFSFGGSSSNGVRKNIVNSNPHVLVPLTYWNAGGGTPLRSAIMQMIQMFKSLPDANDSNVSFVIMVTTDGEADYHDAYTVEQVAKEIRGLTQGERWTFVFRVPRGGRNYLNGYGIPEGNIQEWDTTVAGMEKSTATTAAAMDTFYAARAAGKTSSTVFYADASNVTKQDISKTLVDISKNVSLYVVPTTDNGIQIRDFILCHRMEYLKGAAFYQLTKTEARVSPTKLIIIRDRNDGKMYSGVEARTLIGLDTVNNARLHPGNHGNYDIFIQSESVNRKLVGGTGVIYWKEKGVQFTQEELAKFLGTKAPKQAAPAVVQLPQVAPTNKPTPSPLKPTPKATSKLFGSREAARWFARANGLSVTDLGKGVNPRWAVVL